jgi:hypothetical protein
MHTIDVTHYDPSSLPQPLHDVVSVSGTWLQSIDKLLPIRDSWIEGRERRLRLFTLSG